MAVKLMMMMTQLSIHVLYDEEIDRTCGRVNEVVSDGKPSATKDVDNLRLHGSQFEFVLHFVRL